MQQPKVLCILISILEISLECLGNMTKINS